jgi:hypothetical protein
MSYHFRISNCFHTVEDLEKSQDETLYKAYKLPDNCPATLRSTVGLGMYLQDGGSALNDNLLHCVVDDGAALEEYVVVVRCSFEKSIKVVVEKRVDAVGRALSLFNLHYDLEDECDTGSFSLTTLGLTKVSSGDE